MTAHQMGQGFSNFQTHAKPIPLRGMAQRDAEGMRVSRSGRSLTVAGRLIDPLTPGATPIRQGSTSGHLVVYMSNVFFDKPDIRPKQAAWVGMGFRTDAKSPWFTVYLGLAMGIASKTSARTGPGIGDVQPAVGQVAVSRQEE